MMARENFNVKANFYFLLAILFVFTNNAFSQNFEIWKLDKLKIVNPKIFTVLDTIYKFEMSSNPEILIFILNINDSYDKIEIKAALLNRSAFKWYFYDKKINVFGVTNYNGIDVLVFGNRSSLFFEKRIKVDFPIFRKQLKVNRKKNRFAPIYDFFVWVYYLKDNRFILDKRGSFPIW